MILVRFSRSRYGSLIDRFTITFTCVHAYANISCVCCALTDKSFDIKIKSGKWKKAEEADSQREGKLYIGGKIGNKILFLVSLRLMQVEMFRVASANATRQSRLCSSTRSSPVAHFSSSSFDWSRAAHSMRDIVRRHTWCHLNRCPSFELVLYTQTTV